ncbi:hypothetical protein N0V90_008813 [Kalmusia sp. IMI 367209]|nr:hypothetical protein N0V90_008813 [Kalmusia sp. IMI 367209]
MASTSNLFPLDNYLIESFARETIQASIDILREFDNEFSHLMRETNSISKVMDINVAQALLDDKEKPWPLSVMISSVLWNCLDQLFNTATEIATFKLDIPDALDEYTELHKQRRFLSRLSTFTDSTAKRDLNGLIVSEMIPLGHPGNVSNVSTTCVDYDIIKHKKLLKGFYCIQAAAKWKQMILARASQHPADSARLHKCYVQNTSLKQSGKKKVVSVVDSDDRSETMSMTGQYTHLRCRKTVAKKVEGNDPTPIILTPTSSRSASSAPDTEIATPKPLHIEALSAEDLEFIHITYNATLYSKAGTFSIPIDAKKVKLSEKQSVNAAKDIWVLLATKGCKDKISLDEILAFVKKAKSQWSN